jgi:hypothetical protein
MYETKHETSYTGLYREVMIILIHASLFTDKKFKKAFVIPITELIRSQCKK